MWRKQTGAPTFFLPRWFEPLPALDVSMRLKPSQGRTAVRPRKAIESRGARSATADAPTSRISFRLNFLPTQPLILAMRLCCSKAPVLVAPPLRRGGLCGGGVSKRCNENSDGARIRGRAPAGKGRRRGYQCKSLAAARDPLGAGIFRMQLPLTPARNRVH